VTTLRRRLRHTRLGLQALLATAVILAALVVGIMQLAVLPWLAAHPERISAFLGERLHRPVRIDQVEARWERNGPLLDLHGVHIGEDRPAQPALVIARAALKINFLSFAHRNTRWNEFRLDGLDLNLQRDADGHWSLSGLAPGDASENADQRALFGLGALVLRDLTVSVNDAGSGRQFRFGTDELRLVNFGDEHRIAARVRCLQTQSAPIDTVVEYDSATDNGTAYFGGNSLDLAAILHGYPVFGTNVVRGNGRAQVWGQWRAGDVTSARIEVSLNDLVVEAQTPIELDDKRGVVPRINFNTVAFGARWLRGDQGWSADIADLRLERQQIALPAAAAHIQKKGAGDDPAGAGYVVRLWNVDVSAPASLAMLAEGVPSAWRHWLYSGNPEGSVRMASLRWAGRDDFDVQADLDGIAWRAMDKLPGVSGLRGALTGDEQALALELPAHGSFSVDVPRIFRKRFDFTEFAGTLAVYAGDTGWRLETDSLLFEGAGFGGELRGALEFPDAGGRPSIDAYAVVNHAVVPASHQFWAINVMPPPTVAWLDRALDSGRVVAGRAAIRGDLTDWPFRDFSGRFDARAEVQDLALKYLPDWPAGEHIHVFANFVNAGLHVEADAGQIRGNRIERASADIADFGEAILDLDVGAQGAGRDLLGLVKASPLGLRFGTQLLGVEVGGEGKVDFHLHVPIKHVEDLALAGTVAISDADLADAKYALRFTHANGKVRFSNNGFSADDLAVIMQGQPATFGLAVGAFTANNHHAVEAALSANLPASTVTSYAPSLSAFIDRVTGSTTWNASFSADVGDNATQQLQVSSDLRGLTSTLPAPLDKPADKALPLRLTLGMPLGGGSLDLRVGELVHMRGRLASAASPFAARVTLGGDSEEAVPKTGFVVTGKTPSLDLSGWLDFATSGSGGGGLLSSVDTTVDSLSVWGRDFGEARFKLAQAADGLDLGFVGAQLDGNVHVPLSNLLQRGITVQFAHLYWPESPEGDSDDTTSSANPAALPPLHVHVTDFRLGKENFGETTVESFPIAGGTQFDQVRTHSKNAELRAHGEWTGRPGSDRSAFTIELSSQNIGNMLDAFGYANVIPGGQAVAHIEGNWAGAPSAFALARLDGTLKVSLKNGRVPDADPGSARVLGLFNLAAIPRRLAFDFGDLFKTGFSFDSIDGVFSLKSGNAHTDNLEVRSPTADMTLKGRMGLKEKDWDQTIVVTPHVGGTLAVGGALIGGPVGAAAGVLLQGVFRNQINSVARAQYKVTGSWDDPKITVLAKQTLKAKKATTKPGAEASPDGAPEPKSG